MKSRWKVSCTGRWQSWGEFLASRADGVSDDMVLFILGRDNKWKQKVSLQICSPLSLRSNTDILATVGKQTSSSWLPPVPRAFPLRFNSTSFSIEFDAIPSNTLLTTHKQPHINLSSPMSLLFCLSATLFSSDQSLCRLIKTNFT